MAVLKKITPDPIVDSVVEIRFQPAIPKDEVFITLFKEFNTEFPKFKLSSVPQQFRQNKQFAQFLYAVDGTIANEEYSLGIGSNVVTFNCVNGYKGWGKYFEIIKKALNKISDKGMIAKIERLGIRYTNFFKDVDYITKNLNLSIDFGVKKEYTTSQTVFITEISKGKFSHLLNVTDKAVLGEKTGSLIDIDTSINEITCNISKDFFELIDECRDEERYLFSTLLKEDFIQKFNPEYH